MNARDAARDGPPELRVTPARLGDVDGDLDFFAGLFDDLPETDEDVGDTDADARSSLPSAPPSPPIAAVIGRGDRRRRRWQMDTEQGNAAGQESWTSTGWKEIATRQKQQRAAVERENAQLRAVVDAHVQTTRRIVKLTQKAVLLAARQGLVYPVPRLEETLYLGPPSSDLPRVLRELDELSREADVVLTSRRFESMELEVLSSDIRIVTTATGTAIETAMEVRRIARDLDTFTHAADAKLSSLEHTSSLRAGTFVVENRIVPTATGAALESTVEMAWLLPFETDAIARALLANSIRLVTRKNQRHVQTVYEDATLKIVHAVSAAKEKHERRTAKYGQIATRLEPSRSDGSQLLTLATRGGFAVDSKIVLTVEGGGFIHVSRIVGHDSESLGPLSRVLWRRQIRAQPPLDSHMAQAERGRWLHGITIQKERKAQRQVDKIALAFESLLLTNPRG